MTKPEILRKKVFLIVCILKGVHQYYYFKILNTPPPKLTSLMDDLQDISCPNKCCLFQQWSKLTKKSISATRL